MTRIGQILLDHGWVTPDRLARALGHQRLLGGRLGTCLLETDAIDERILLQALSLQLNVPPADYEDLRDVPAKVIALIPEKVARRFRAVPFRLLGGQLSVAMLGAGNLALEDELAFVTGRRTVVHVAHEARLFAALERYYGEDCPTRFRQLVDRLNRSRYLWGTQPGELPEQLPEPSDAPEWELPELSPRPIVSPPRRPTAPPVEAVTPSPRAEPPPPVIAPPASPPTPAPAVAGATLTLEEAESRLVNPGNRDAVGAVLLDYCRSRFRRTVLLILRKHELTGWMSAGEGTDLGALKSFRVDLDLPSAFNGLRHGAAFFRGELADLPVHRAFAPCLGDRSAADCLIVPVVVRGRPMVMIYGDRLHEGVGSVDLAELQRLAVKAAIAFELCIVRKKLLKA